jgi:carboxymethylenebutenolidase
MKLFSIIFALFLSINTYALIERNIMYGKSSSGYYVTPNKMHNSKALILIHEWWGLNQQIKATARRFAKLGYAVLAVDLYDGKNTTTRERAKQLATKVRKNKKKAFENLRAAVNFLKVQKGINSKRLGSVGWCFGGGWSLEMAKSDMGLQSSIIYYGRFNPKDDLEQMKTKIMGHFGEKDRVILASDVRAWKALLRNKGKEHRIFIYPNSGHAFFNEESKAFNKKDADLSWKRTIEFLNENL